MKRIFSLIIILIIMLGFTVTTYADLVDRGGGLIYDTELQITWLQDANYAATNMFGVEGILGPGSEEPGLMGWDTAKSWIAAMNAANYLGFSDWRLPKTSWTTGGFTSEGEMAQLFYELGGVENQSITATHNSNYDLFINILLPALRYYWYSNEYAPVLGNAWAFTFSNYQYPYGIYTNCGVWTVRDGDSAPVPEPSLIVLLGISVLSLAGLKRWWKD